MAISEKAIKFLEDGINRGKPIPGQSLTNSPSQPYAWESPPEIVEPRKAMYEVFDALTQPEATANLLISLNKGVGVIDLASIVLYSGFIEGKWSPDLMALLMEPTMYMIMALAEKAEISYSLDAGDDEEGPEMSGEQQLNRAQNSLDILKKEATTKVSDAAVPKDVREMIADVELEPSLLARVDKESQPRESLLEKGEE
tara:strand:+ start:1049 stop:1645 length:597 start_codon:yes stop_codon:yes gene_type:complete